MSDLAGLSVLVVEDSYYLAIDVMHTLVRAGARVLGPCADSSAAFACLAVECCDLAILDIHLERGTSFDLGHYLRQRAVPFIFFTGYGQTAVPGDFADIVLLQKPVDRTRLLRAVQQLVAERERAPSP